MFHWGGYSTSENKILDKKDNEDQHNNVDIYRKYSIEPRVPKNFFLLQQMVEEGFNNPNPNLLQEFLDANPDHSEDLPQRSTQNPVPNPQREPSKIPEDLPHSDAINTETNPFRSLLSGKEKIIYDEIESLLIECELLHENYSLENSKKFWYKIRRLRKKYQEELKPFISGVSSCIFIIENVRKRKNKIIFLEEIKKDKAMKAIEYMVKTFKNVEATYLKSLLNELPHILRESKDPIPPEQLDKIVDIIIKSGPSIQFILSTYPNVQKLIKLYPQIIENCNFLLALSEKINKEGRDSIKNSLNREYMAKISSFYKIILNAVEKKEDIDDIIKHKPRTLPDYVFFMLRNQFDKILGIKGNIPLLSSQTNLPFSQQVPNDETNNVPFFFYPPFSCTECYQNVSLEGIPNQLFQLQYKCDTILAESERRFYYTINTLMYEQIALSLSKIESFLNNIHFFFESEEWYTGYQSLLNSKKQRETFYVIFNSFLEKKDESFLETFFSYIGDRNLKNEEFYPKYMDQIQKDIESLRKEILNISITKNKGATSINEEFSENDESYKKILLGNIHNIRIIINSMIRMMLPEFLNEFHM